ncbi:MAG: hypothetical protein ACE5EZ_05525 [Thermodesulfobacteriota bacterium]
MINISRRPRRDFLPESSIAAGIAESNNFDPSEDIANARGFILFDSVGKRVWLMATKLRLYSMTDNRTGTGPRIDWSISRSRLFSRGLLCLQVIERKGEGEGNGESEKAIVDIGYRKGNAFSPRLFMSRSLEERIRALIEERMG